MNRTGMTGLRRKIVWCFVIIIFIVRVIDSAIDSTWDSIIAPSLYPDGDYTNVFDVWTISYMGASLLVYIASAIIFYYLVKKMIEKESLRQVNEQNILYAAIAHDIKTPMTSVQGFAGALAEGKVKQEEQQEIYNIIYNKSKAMNSLVDTLFEYAKFGTKEYKPFFEEVDLTVLVREVVAENYCDFEEHGIEPEIDIPDSQVIIKADKKELRRAISNLIINTFKHNPTGIKVLIRLHSVDNKPELIIADSGNVIPKDMNVFEPFVTENKVRSIGQGTGLGLAITKRVIDEHNAGIYIKEDIPEYTKAFVVEFK